ncbi:MAG: hypothetical protein ACK5RY_03445 [Dolichospermum sp.]|nr:hypothetical protein [Anabaena sp. 49628_E55]
MTREQGTGNREEGRGFGQLYFLLLMSVFFVHLLILTVSPQIPKFPEKSGV